MVRFSHKQASHLQVKPLSFSLLKMSFEFEYEQ